MSGLCVLVFLPPVWHRAPFDYCLRIRANTSKAARGHLGHLWVAADDTIRAKARVSKLSTRHVAGGFDTDAYQLHVGFRQRHEFQRGKMNSCKPGFCQGFFYPPPILRPY